MKILVWRIVISLMVVIGILGVLVNDIIWKEVGYLFVIFLMMDLLYKIHYGKFAKSQKKEEKEISK